MRKKSYWVKVIAVLSAAVLAASPLAGCGSKGKSQKKAAEEAATDLSAPQMAAADEGAADPTWADAEEDEDADAEAPEEKEDEKKSSAEEAGTATTAEIAAAKAAAEAAEAQAQVRKAAKKADIQAKGGTIVVSAHDWGPGVGKVILKLQEPVDGASAQDAVMNTALTDRQVSAVYLCDKEGNQVAEPSKYVAVEMETTFTSSGSPFTYDMVKTMQNDWSDEYEVDGLLTVTVDGQEKSLGISKDLIDSRVAPEAELFTDRDTFSGKYKNPMTGKKEKITLQRGAYEPQALADDGVKNPLIIWLHGQGEGGTDIDITLLGNEVTALAKSPIQDEFTTDGGAAGAYVLAVQCRTYWMDGGDGTNSSGDLTSRYTKALMDAIQDYVKNHDDVDTSRIYLGGCSNGGYMTVNMLVQYPDYWAAAYPNCEAYAFNVYKRDENGAYVTKSVGNAMGGAVVNVPTKKRWLTDKKVQAIKDIPIWFVVSADDPIVNPSQYVFPTYQALLQAGATNCYLSCFDKVVSREAPYSQYLGHWVWTYLFKNAVTNVQSQDAVKSAAAGDESFGVTPSPYGGASIAQDTNRAYANIFQWLNAQKKAEK